MEYFFDYACPFCYVSFFQLLPYKNRIRKPLLFYPAEVHPYPEETADFTTAPAWWQDIVQRAEKLKVPIKYQGKMPRTHIAIAQLLYLQECGMEFWRYHQLVFEAIFQKGMEIENEQVLQNLLEDNNIQHMWEEGKADYYLQKVPEANRYAYEKMGIAAFPTVVQEAIRIESVVQKGIEPQIWQKTIQDWLL